MGNGFGMGFGGGFMWFFWILLILIVVWLIKGAVTPGEGRRDRAESALEILQARYARGEIDRDEFEAKRRDLSR